MSDMGLFLKNTDLGEIFFDIDIDNNDLASDEGLETAVIISLFSDRRVSEEQLPDLETDKRGYWGDTLNEIDQDKIGSRLWTLARSKIDSETLNAYNELSKESLNWLLEDGIASAIDIITEYNEAKHLTMQIDITKFIGENRRFSFVWDGQKLRRG